MLIPWQSDAPLYHRPWGTCALIALNVLIFAAWQSVDSALMIGWFLLPFGEGLTPIRWLTSACSQYAFMHLFGNMVFLWTFGLVIEGKLGWRRFTGLYFGMAAAVGLCEQLIMWNAVNGGSLGASSVIYGLMVLALFWAPMNRMDCLFWYGLVRTFEVPIWALALFYIGCDLLGATGSGFAMSTPLLHLLGVAAGLPVALVFLERGWVDCEGWDLLTFMRQGRPERRPDAALLHERAERAEAQRAQRERERADALVRLDQLLAEDQALGALALRERVEREGGPWPLPPAQARALIEGLCRQEAWQQAGVQLADALDAHPQLAGGLRLARPRILIGERRPTKALEALRAIDPATLATASERELHRTLTDEAEALVADGVLELMD